MCSPRQQWMPNYQHCPAPAHHLMMTMTCLPYIKTTIGRSSIGTRSLTQQMKTSFVPCYCHCYCQSLTRSFLSCGLTYENVQESRLYCKSEQTQCWTDAAECMRCCAIKVLQCTCIVYMSCLHSIVQVYMQCHIQHTTSDTRFLLAVAIHMCTCSVEARLRTCHIKQHAPSTSRRV